VNNPDVLQQQMIFKVRNSPDFAGMSEAAALSDLKARIKNYTTTYQTVSEAEGAYIKLFDLRAKVAACNIFGRMSKSVLPFLLALHTVQRSDHRTRPPSRFRTHTHASLRPPPDTP
jgi:hypothetical protein